MTKIFHDFKTFSMYMTDVYSKMPSFLNPLNLKATLNKTWATAFRLPDYLLEPIFLQVFNRSADEFPTSTEVKDKALEVRKSAVEIMQNKKPVLYFQDNKNFWKIKKAVLLTMQSLQLYGKKFDIASIDDAAAALPSNTSSGHPDYIQNKGINIGHITSQAKECLNTKNISWVEYLCTMAWRTQTRPSGLKYRIIWVTPHISQVFEMCFFLPIQKHFQNNKFTPYCFGNVWLDLKERVVKLRKFKMTVVLDFQSFDQTIPFELIQIFFRSIKSLYKIHNNNWNVQFEAICFYNLGANIFNNYNKPIIFRKSGSLLSGSVFTNFMGTWINLFLMHLYLVEFNLTSQGYLLNMMGDDNVNGFDFDFDVNHYSTWLKDTFGMIIKPEKCQVLGPDFKTVEFLGSEINEEGRFINVDLAERQLITSERFIPEAQMPESVRLVSKAASIYFKFTNGWKYFDDLMRKLSQYINVDSDPEYYYEIFASAAGPFDQFTQRRFAEFKYDGWMIQ